MNVHVRSLLRDGAVNAGLYNFEIGQAVDHIGGKLKSVIVDREFSLMGRQLYHLAVTAEDAAGRPFRVVCGDHLVAA
jgi:hypothetical protein